MYRGRYELYVNEDKTSFLVFVYTFSRKCISFPVTFTYLAIPGHGVLIAITPSTLFPSRTLPLVGSNTTESIPYNGLVHDPGFIGVTPGILLTTMPPVSVCLWNIVITSLRD